MQHRFRTSGAPATQSVAYWEGVGDQRDGMDGLDGESRTLNLPVRDALRRCGVGNERCLICRTVSFLSGAPATQSVAYQEGGRTTAFCGDGLASAGMGKIPRSAGNPLLRNEVGGASSRPPRWSATIAADVGRAVSSAARAFASHARGRRFESCTAHHRYHRHPRP